MFWTIVIIFAVIGVAVAFTQQRALREAKEAYEAALARLSENPDDNDRRVAALAAGRHYADLARKAAGSKGRAIFDEVALNNDMTARLGRSGPPAAALPAGGGVAAAGGDRVAQLTRLAELRDKGVLTTEEFEKEKRRILGG